MTICLILFIFITLFIVFLVLYLNSRDSDSNSSFKNKEVLSPYFVTISLKGGLGNQLFELANGYAIAKREKRIFLIDYGQKISSENRPTYWDNFLTFLRNNRIKNDVDYKWTTIYEQGFHFTKVPTLPHDENVILDGVFQSEKYFQSIKDEWIDQILKPFEHLSVPWMISENEEVVAIHIRRGDYLNLELHVVQPIQYYGKAFEKLQTMRPENTKFKIIVFSNDLPWCQKFLPFHFNKDILFYIEQGSDYEQIIYMSKCHHHIIANSSFSWWGAYLNNWFKDQQVFAPKQWFSENANINWQDIYCQHWYVI